MAREKSFLPPEELKAEQPIIKEVPSTEIIVEKKEVEQPVIVQNTPIVEKTEQADVVITTKPVEIIESSPTKEEPIVQKESNIIPEKPVITTPKPENPISQSPLPAPASGSYTVQVGYFSLENNARSLAKEIENKGFQAFVIKHNNAFKVQVGSYDQKEKAEDASRQLKRLGYETWVTQR